MKERLPRRELISDIAAIISGLVVGVLLSAALIATAYVVVLFLAGGWR